MYFNYFDININVNGICFYYHVHSLPFTFGMLLFYIHIGDACDSGWLRYVEFPVCMRICRMSLSDGGSLMFSVFVCLRLKLMVNYIYVPLAMLHQKHNVDRQ